MSDMTAAMMAAPSKPDFDLASPSGDRQRSHSGHHRERSDIAHNLNSHGSPKKKSKYATKSGLNGFVKDVSEFTNNANSNFNPEYREFDRTMSEVLDKFQTHIEQFQAARDSATQQIAAFQQHVSSVHVTYKKELEELDKWQAPEAKIEHMQERVAQLKHLLASSKAKLQKIDKELTEEEENSKSETQTKRRYNGSALTFTVIVLAIAFWMTR